MAVQTSKILAWLTVVMVVIHASLMILLHVLVPEVNPVSGMVSAYLVSDYQVLARTTFFVLGLMLAFLGVSLLANPVPGILFKLACGFMVLALIGFMGVAVFPEEAMLFASFTQPAMILFILLLSIAVRSASNWQPVGGLLVLISILLLIMFVITIALGILPSAGIGGLANRLVLVLIYLWALLIVRGLLTSLDKESASSG